jgi:hypothetical protein
MSRRSITPQTVRSLAWSLAAIATSGLVVAVGCGDDAGGSGSAQGGGSGGTDTSGVVGPDTSSPSASAGSGDGGATSGSVASVVSAVTQGPGPVTVSSSAGGGTGGEGGGGLAGCDPPASADELYGRIAVDYVSLQETRLCDYRGQVLLIVNVAAK